jgi:Protein of unknown function (DUF2795)/PRC-barrel domain
MTTMDVARGKTLFTSDGEQLGQVDTIMDDVQTHKPEWFVIRSTEGIGQKRLLVPVKGSDVRDDGVFVSYSAEQVRATPQVRGDEISQDTEQRLYSHYGLRYSERRSRTGLPERPKGREGAQRGRSGGRVAKQAGDEPTRDELYNEAKRLDIKGRSKMNKRDLLRAVEKARGTSKPSSRGQAKANPVEVQKFLEGVRYPATRRELLQEAKRQRASKNVRSTLERLPDERFDAPTDVSEAIGKLS